MRGHKPNSARLKANFKLNEVPLSLEEFSKKLYENNKGFLPGLAILEEKYKRQFFRDVMGPDPFPSELVAPAAGKGPDVEQQAEEEIMQLSEPVKGEPEV